METETEIETSSSFQSKKMSRCIVCHIKFKCSTPSSSQLPSDLETRTEAKECQNVNVCENSENNESSWERFYYIFHLYNYIDVDSDNLNSNEDLTDPSIIKNYLPFCFCPSCKPVVINLVNLHKQLESIQEEYTKTVANISLKIVTSCDISENSGNSNNSDNLGNSESNKNIDDKMNIKIEENIFTKILENNGNEVDDTANSCAQQQEKEQEEEEDPRLVKTTEHVRRCICHHYSPKVVLKEIRIRSRRPPPPSKPKKKKNKDKQKYENKKSSFSHLKPTSKTKYKTRKHPSSFSDSKSKSKSRSKIKTKTKHKISALLKNIKTEVVEPIYVDNDEDNFEGFQNQNDEDDDDNYNENELQNEFNSSSTAAASLPLPLLLETNDDDFASYFPPDETELVNKRVKRIKRRKKPVEKIIRTLPLKNEKKFLGKVLGLKELDEILGDSENEEDLEELEEDSDFDPEKETKAMRDQRKFVAEENKQFARSRRHRTGTKKAKSMRRRGPDPDLIPFQQLVLPWKEISPGQFMYGEKCPYERLDEDGDYFCKVGDCNFASKVQTDIFKHMNNMHNESRFPCHVCQRSYKLKTWLEQHDCQPKQRQRRMFKIEEQEDGSFLYHEKWHFTKLGNMWKCSTCGAIKSQRTIMGTHIREHHIEPERYKCDLCGTAFGNKKSYTCHMEQHTETRDYLCELCSASFRSLRNLKVHARFHSKIIHECNVCNKKFLYKEGLGRHRRQTGHLSEKLLAVATDTGSASASMSMPMLTNDQLPAESNSNSNPAQDIDIETPSGVVAVNLDLNCPRCSCPHENAQSFNLHLRYCGKPAKYLCDHCSKSFNVKASLLIHIERFHSENGNRDGEVEFEPWKKKSRRRMNRELQDRSQNPNPSDSIVPPPPVSVSVPLPILPQSNNNNNNTQQSQQQQEHRHQFSASDNNLQHIPGFPLPLSIPIPNFFSQMQLQHDHNFN